MTIGTGPDFLIIGAAKSGTSALYRQLASHPEIFMSRVKEPNYYALMEQVPCYKGPGDADTINRRSVTNTEAYKRLFNGLSVEKVMGEASTLYLYSDSAPANIHKLIPGVKLIAILRDPVERAYSSSWHLIRDGLERLPFEEALEEEPRRIAGGWSHIWHYQAAGLYAEQLRRYRALFPRSQLRVYVYEEYRRTPLKVLTDIFRFLEVDAGFQPATDRRYNISGVPRYRLVHRLVVGQNPLKSAFRALLPRTLRGSVHSFVQRWNVRPGKPELDAALRRRLREYFAQDVEDLKGLFDLDLTWWE